MWIAGMWMAVALATPRSQAPKGLWDHWGDGRAELATYSLTQPRYGEARSGEVVWVTVTEDFTRGQRVKAERPHPDAFPVVKLNDMRDFQTGIYDYHAMTSVFVPLDGSLSLGLPTKASFSMQEWCGQMYEHLVVDPSKAKRVLHSYFDGEADQDEVMSVPADGVFADAMPLLVRGLAGELVKPGQTKTVPWFGRALDRRMGHLPARWTSASITRSSDPEAVTVPAGDYRAWVWTVAADGVRTRWWVEAAPPHRVVRWEVSTGEVGQLLSTAREPYWSQQREGMEAKRTELGLPLRTWP